jgi:hypothetical protein
VHSLTAGDFAWDEEEAWAWAVWVRPAWWGAFRCRRGDAVADDAPPPDSTIQVLFAPGRRGPGAPLAEAEVQQVQWAIDHEREVMDALLAALIPHYARLRQERAPDQRDDRLMPEVSSPDGFRPLIQLETVVVHDVAGLGDMPYVGLDFSCTWEDGHGLGVMMQGPRVVGIGNGEAAFQRALADRDARRTGVLPPFDIDLESKELVVMDEVGRLRSRSMGRAFLVGWVALLPLCLGFGGLIGATLVSAAVAGVFARGWVSMRTDDHMAAACKKHGVDPESLARADTIIE